jgi:hypothetical protein
MADYHSIIAKAVSALDLNTEKARRRLYERARAALQSKMHSAYPPFHRSEIAAEEMSLDMAIEAVEASLMREQNAKMETLATSPLRAGFSVTPSLRANQNGEVRHSRATLWAGILRRAHAPGRGKAMSNRDNNEDGSCGGGCTWMTELLARASRAVDNNEQNFTPRRTPAQSHNAKRQRP